MPNLIVRRLIGNLILAKTGQLEVSTPLLFLTLAVVARQVAVLAETLGVVEFLAVDTGPCLLCAAAAVVAIDAHILRVVLATLVGAGHDLPALLVRVLTVAAHLVVLLLELFFLLLLSAPELIKV